MAPNLSTSMNPVSAVTPGAKKLPLNPGVRSNCSGSSPGVGGVGGSGGVGVSSSLNVICWISSVGMFIFHHSSAQS